MMAIQRRTSNGFYRQSLLTVRQWGSLPALFVLGVLGLALSGCGSGEVRGQIAGKVTFQGKSLSEGAVMMSHETNGVNIIAKVSPDGSYKMSTYKGAGLPLGKYKVCVCPPVYDGLAMAAPPKARKSDKMNPDDEYPNIPKKYREFETSKLTLTVNEGENPFDIDMK